MKKTTQALIGTSAIALLASAFSTQAAFIIEPTPGKAFANYRYVGGTNSISAAPTDSAAFGLTAGNGSIFGGNNATADEYVFKYTLGADVDNTVITAGMDLGNGDLASGLTGGVTGTYNVYATWPSTFNVSGGGSDFWLNPTGSSSTHLFDVADFNQNDSASGAGDNPGANKWWLIGTAELDSGTTYELHVKANNATFVSQRMDGVMFELQPVPEPSTLALGLLGGAGLMAGYLRRRKK